MGLRAMVKAESDTVVVAQRLKRMDRILGKLVRMRDTKLTRMEDVGGWRAVLGDDDVVSAALERIRRRWKVTHHVECRSSFSQS